MGLIAHYRLDGDATDAIGNNHGTASNVTWVDGKLGKAGDFDGESGHLDCGDDPTFQLLKSVSISLWYKSNDENYTPSWIRFAGKGYDNSYQIGLTSSSQNPNFRIHGENGTDLTTASTVVTDGKWHHITGTYDGDTIKIYVDGVMENLTPFSDTIKNPPSNFLIGAVQKTSGTKTAHAKGKIDDVRIYDHALSQREVRDLHNGTILHVVPNPQSPVDSSGNDYTITPYNVQYTQESPVGGGSYYFDGNAGTYLDCTNQVFRNHDRFSVSLWFRRQTDQAEYTNHSVHNVLLAKASNSHNDNFELGTDGGSIEAYFDAGSSNTTQNIPASITNNQWYHLVLAYDQGSLDVYLDGQNLGTYNVDSPLDSGADPSPFTIGESQHEGAPFHGDITDVRLFATVLSPDYVQELYQQRASIDNVGNLHVQKLNDSVVETFADGSFDDEWSTPNFFIQSDVGYFGQYSAGSNNQGPIDAVWSPKELIGGKRITFFEYYWYEWVSQTGHGVELIDSNDNRVLLSGTENPQWHLNDGDGNTQIYPGDDYNHWIYYRFDFNWDNGTYDYYLKDTETGTIRTGTRNLSNSVDVEKVEFISAFGGANHNRFDGLRFGVNQIASENGSTFSDVSEMGSYKVSDYIPYDQWVVGTSGSQGDFSKNGGSDENQIIEYPDPWGKTVPVWEMAPDGNSGANGGWNASFNSDNTHTLRLSVFAKKTQSTDGTTYFGCDKGNTLTLGGSQDGNPYFWSGNLPNLDEWYLMVGIVHPNNYSGNDTGISGVYDLNGNKVIDVEEFKFDTGNQQTMRAYLYYSNSTTPRQYFVYPRVDIMDGSEPSIMDLVTGVEHVMFSGSKMRQEKNITRVEGQIKEVIA